MDESWTGADFDALVESKTADLERRFAAHQRTARLWRRTSRLPERWRRLARASINRVAAADIDARLEIPFGVILMHRGLGDVVHGSASICPPSIVFHRATIGNAWQRNDGVPTIRPFSFIGAGATVIGRIQIGPVSAVGAEAVVTQDVPPFTLASGVPARVTPLAIDSLQRWFGLTRDELEHWIS